MVSKGLRMRYKAALSDRFFGCSAIKMDSFMISLILSPGHTAKRHIFGVALPSDLSDVTTNRGFGPFSQCSALPTTRRYDFHE